MFGWEELDAPPGEYEVASTGEIEPTTTTTTTAKPQPIVPTATTTSSTVPTVEIDLSELDSLVDELDGLLGSLGAAMNQIGTQLCELMPIPSENTSNLCFF